MELFSVECFLSAAENMNLSKAAIQMNITQPAMSIQIKNLEKEIGVSLFERDSRRMRLTLAGEIVKKAFLSIIGSYNSMMWQVQSLDQEKPCLRIGYHGPSNWAGVPGLFQQFLKENPDVQVSIQQAEFGELAAKLEEGRLELAFLENSDTEGRDALKWVPLFDDYGTFALSKSHPLAGRKRIHPEEMKDQKVYFNLRQSASMQEIFRKLTRSGIAREQLVCVNGTETAIAMALAYDGLAALPMSFKTDTNHQITYLDNQSSTVHLRFCLAWRKDSETEPLQRFVRICQTYSWPDMKAGGSDGSDEVLT